jgi:DNA primase
VNFHGRNIDAVSFWNRYVDLPPNTRPDKDTFADLVQCPNPAHDTTKRHFQVNLHEPMVHCFAHCGISGSWEHAICVIEGLYEKFKVEEATNERERKRRLWRARKQARKLIIKGSSPSKFHEKPGVRKKVDTRRAAKAVSADALTYERFLPSLALDYVEERGLTDSSVAKWELGWLPEDKRLVIPARDLDNRLRFLIKRGLTAKQQPKYLYTEGFPKTSLLFGACGIDLGLVHSAGLILVEGSLDTILFHQHGLSNTVGILGTGISDKQAEIIAKFRPPRVTFAFDRDSAGMRNIEIASLKLRKYPQYVMRYPTGKYDPAELTKEEAIRQISKAVPFAAFKRKARLNPRRGKEIYGTHKV